MLLHSLAASQICTSSIQFRQSISRARPRLSVSQRRVTLSLHGPGRTFASSPDHLPTGRVCSLRSLRSLPSLFETHLLESALLSMRSHPWRYAILGRAHSSTGTACVSGEGSRDSHAQPPSDLATRVPFNNMIVMACSLLSANSARVNMSVCYPTVVSQGITTATLVRGTAPWVKHDYVRMYVCTSRVDNACARLQLHPLWGSPVELDSSCVTLAIVTIVDVDSAPSRQTWPQMQINTRHKHRDTHIAVPSLAVLSSNCGSASRVSRNSPAQQARRTRRVHTPSTARRHATH